jgi:hypothetical protein
MSADAVTDLTFDSQFTASLNRLARDYYSDIFVCEDGDRLKALVELLRGATFPPDPPPNPDYSGGCWLIRQELRSAEGYGILDAKNPGELGGTVPRSAHKVSYLIAHRDFPKVINAPDGKEPLEIHHRCPNRACFRPFHLQVTTSEQNAHYRATGKSPKQFHRCGLAFDTFYFKKDGTVERRCSICRNGDSRRSHAKATTTATGTALPTEIYRLTGIDK